MSNRGFVTTDEQFDFVVPFTEFLESSLLDYGLVKITREAGNSKMYQINKDSEPAQALAEFEWKLLDQLDGDGKPDARVDERLDE